MIILNCKKKCFYVFFYLEETCVWQHCMANMGGGLSCSFDETSHGQMFDLLHFGYTFSTLLGRQIKGRGRGHQPFPNKIKYCWPKVLVGPPLKSVVCWVGFPFLRI